MKRTRASTIWAILGILASVALLVVSTSLVLASQGSASPTGDTLVANVDTGTGGGDLASAPLSITTPITMFLPLASRTYFEYYLYADDFQVWDTGWPYGEGAFDYGYKEDDDDSRVYHLRLNSEDDMAFITGPGRVGGNFDLTIWMRHVSSSQPKHYGDEYGLLISPAPIDPSNPYVNGAYTFHIHLQMGSGIDSKWMVSKWTSANRGDRTEDGYTESLLITDVKRVWNIFQIQRVGDRLYFRLTREGIPNPLSLAYETDDASLPYMLHVGFYASHAPDDKGSYSIEYQFDNLIGNSYKP